MKFISKLVKNSKSLWFLLFFISIKTIAQKNLVPNYSFEIYTICPTSVNNSPLPFPWFQPTDQQNQDATYFNSCSSSSTYGIPSNYWGYQYARTGNAYAAISTISLQYPNSERYYAKVNLTDSLLKNKSYYVEFYISNFNRIQYNSNNISLLFTRKAIYIDTLIDPLGVLQANPQITGFYNPIITDTMNWVKVSGIYKAQGGERYITIGNFKNDNQTNYLQLNNSNTNCACATYYLDDVSVIPLDSMCLKADAGRDTTIKVGDSVFIGSYTNGIDTIKWYNANGQVIDSTRPGFWVKPTNTGTSFYVLQQTVNGCFSSDTVWVNVNPLPLKMVGFTALYQTPLTPPQEGNVLLQWQTANEVNVSHYNIERSLNAKDFVTIGKVKANNKTSNEYRQPLTVYR